ncbi:hypothetical protein C1H46_008451 [Malus baccata]|uniref:Uncharacterized protein n=1 Tax=Malus baccata TaxID=106549 RepID=A0A540N4E0_MALBA|nr:hypothetical protein C1H46_008451 [Malus baccata]
MSSSSVVEVGRKKQKASITKKPTFVSRKEPLGVDIHQKANDFLNSTLNELEVGERVSSIGQDSTPKSSIPPPVLMVTLTSQFNPSTGEILHFVEDNNNSGPGEGSGNSPPPLVSKTVLLQPHLAYRGTWIPIPRPKKKAKTTVAHSE